MTSCWWKLPCFHHPLHITHTHKHPSVTHLNTPASTFTQWNPSSLGQLLTAYLTLAYIHMAGSSVSIHNKITLSFNSHLPLLNPDLLMVTSTSKFNVLPYKLCNQIFQAILYLFSAWYSQAVLCRGMLWPTS